MKSKRKSAASRGNVVGKNSEMNPKENQAGLKGKKQEKCGVKWSRQAKVSTSDFAMKYVFILGSLGPLGPQSPYLLSGTGTLLTRLL